MDGRCGGASDEKGSGHAPRRHLAADLLHPVQGRCDQAAHAYDVGAYLSGLVKQRLARHHHAKVRHVESAAGQYDGGYVLTYVMNIALDGGDKEYRFVTDRFRRLHIGLEDGHRIAHYTGGLNDLRQEHPSVPEKLANLLHPVHQGPLYHGDRVTEFFETFQCIFFKIG